MPKGQTTISETVIREVVSGVVLDKKTRRNVRTKLLKDAKAGNEIAASLLEQVKVFDESLQLKRGRKPVVQYANLIDLVPSDDKPFVGSK